jgi:hypothetical protein
MPPSQAPFHGNRLIEHISPGAASHHQHHHQVYIATTIEGRGFVGMLMSTHFYSCRHLLGLQVQRFVE